MFPISDDTLPFHKIADYWSREIQPPASQAELVDKLEAAWWRGEITGISAFTRLEFLRRAWQRSSLDEVVFITPDDSGPSTETPLADGGVLVDLRPRIAVPSEIGIWTDDSCATAFEVLAKSPSREHFPVLQVSLHFIELSSEEFFGWIEKCKFDVPKFWMRNSAENVSEYRTGAPGRPSSSQLVAGELDRRIAAGIRSANMKQEAELLADWLRNTHPNAPPMTAKTIRNKFSKELRGHVGAQN